MRLLSPKALVAAAAAAGGLLSAGLALFGTFAVQHQADGTQAPQLQQTPRARPPQAPAAAAAPGRGEPGEPPVGGGTAAAAAPRQHGSPPPRSAPPQPRPPLVQQQQQQGGSASNESNAECDPLGAGESAQNLKYLGFFEDIFARMRTDWWLDEGGLIGASRAGAMASADDDFDFFALLPEQSAALRGAAAADVHPCARLPDCGQGRFDAVLHSFLLVLWNAGMCVNHFDPDPSKFVSKRRLMWSLMFDRNRLRQPHAATPGARCFDHKGRFAHMHLGVLSQDLDAVLTNHWIPPASKHRKDALPLADIVPTARCRVGPRAAPCPRDPVAYLRRRNGGEYVRSRKDGSCLLIRRKWPPERRRQAAATARALGRCGYASLAPLADPLERSGFESC
eukprot:TRINITY_DN12236_c0_g1_i1.p2 TRINITY_DN12236_c0_g1~~TRINITY_DN12236_c0_g1_i1.p2  ORF type:complete len:426 (+),score=134.26 TRINITY_DN12236_c0_g1_i1:98-1279(+)